jgi:signal transduction histidine kinase
VAFAPVESGCVGAAVAADWLAALRAAPATLEIVAASRAPVAGRPAAPLPPPLDGLVVRPRADVWSDLLHQYRRRIVMIVSEGTFFAVLLFVMLALLWKTLRREVELERQHRNFLSAITHELKSPLAAMRLSLETVLRGRADTTASVRFLENALQDAERLQSLVQKVLEVTRYGRAEGSLTLSRGSVSDAVVDAVSTFSRRATAAGARLDSDVAPGITAQLDEEAFAIVVSNLLENGIKYGGAVPRLAVRLTMEDGRAVLDVSDNGRGIADDDRPFIFNRFYRGGDEMTRTTQGTGLGLYLVRQIVHAHGGAVGVHRTGADGTTFRVSLPGAAVAEEAP